MTANRPPRLWMSACRAVVWLSARVVPASARPQWREEWIAEFWHELTNAADLRDRLGILRGAWGCLLDAFATRALRDRRHALLRAVALDIQNAARALRSQPRFAVVAVVVMGVGIGAASILLTVYDSVLVRPLRLPDSAQLAQVSVHLRDDDSGNEWMSTRVPVATAERWATAAEGRVQIVGVNDSGFDNVFFMAGSDEPRRVRGALVTANFFEVIGAQPILGRTFDRSGVDLDAGVVVIAESLWRSAFGGRDDIVGQEVRLNGRPMRIVAVLPDDTGLDQIAGSVTPGTGASAWVPLAAFPEDALRTRQAGTASYDRVIVRVSPQLDLEAVAAQLDELHRPSIAPGRSEAVTLQSLQEVVSATARQPLALLLGAVAALLVLACTNIAGLQLVRSSERRHELAVRRALGASTAQLVRQLAAETALLAVAGGVVAALTTRSGLELIAAIAPAETPRIVELQVDARTLLIVAAITAVTAILSALMPIRSLLRSLRRGKEQLSARSVVGARRGPEVMVGAQVMLATILLSATFLLVRSVVALDGVDPGFDFRGVTSIDLYRSRQQFAENTAQMSASFDTILGAAHDVAGVDAAAYTSSPPFRARDYYRPRWRLRKVSDGYFETLGMPLLAGRAFSPADTATSVPVVIINDVLARQEFADRAALGQWLGRDDDDPGRLIVGVVAGARHESAAQQPLPAEYTPLSQDPDSRLTLLVRTSGDVGSIVARVREIVARTDPEQPVERIASLAAWRARSPAVASRRFSLQIFAGFALAALGLCALGIHATTRQAVNQRRREFGLRIAVGARHWQLARAVWRRTTLVVLLGGAAGLLGGFSFETVLASSLFGISASDPIAALAVVAGLLVVVLAATVPPIRTTLRTDPVRVLAGD